MMLLLLTNLLYNENSVNLYLERNSSSMSTLIHNIASFNNTINQTAHGTSLRSAVTSTLIVPTTRRRTLGDRAFLVAAARAWNSLPSFVRDQQSLAAFRHQLKTVVFRTYFGEDANA